MTSENVAIMSKESICHQLPFHIRFRILLKTKIESIATKKNVLYSPDPDTKTTVQTKQ